MYSKNTFSQGVCNDGGSHVETSSLCVVPLLWALYRLVVSSITWGSQAQPLTILVQVLILFFFDRPTLKFFQVKRKPTNKEMLPHLKHFSFELSVLLGF